MSPVHALPAPATPHQKIEANSPSLKSGGLVIGNLQDVRKVTA